MSRYMRLIGTATLPWVSLCFLPQNRDVGCVATLCPQVRSQIFPQKSAAGLVTDVQEAAGPAAVQALTSHSGAQLILFVNLVSNPPLNKVRCKPK